MSSEALNKFFKEQHNAYHYTRDNERLFYSTNFPPHQFKPEQPLLIFTYGLVCNNSHWEKQFPYFDERGFQILIHDLRGHFNSSGDETIEKLTIANFAEDIHELLAIFSPKKTFLAGHSMGVNTTLEYVHRYPEHVAGQILISGTVVPPQGVMFDNNSMEILTPWLKKIMDKFPKFFQKTWTSSGLNPLVQYMVLDGGFNKEKVPMQFIQVYINRIAKLKPELFFQLFQEMHDHSVINYLETIKVPTLIMGGSDDKIIPNYLQNILHQKIPNSELYLIQHGSHVPQVDFPDSINQRIEIFINKHTS